MSIIGQQDFIDNFNRSDCRFKIVLGEKGSGKSYLTAQLLRNVFGDKTISYINPTVDSIRQMIDTCYNVTNTHFYIIENADKLSIQARNALLKVTEEPPRNAYFVLLLRDINKIPKTLISRAEVHNIQPYKREEIKQYIQKSTSVSQFSSNQLDNIAIVCTNPGEVNYLLSQDVNKFAKLTKDLILNLDKLSGVESFKLADLISFKADSTGFDLDFVMMSVIRLAMYYGLKGNIDSNKCLSIINITNKYLNILRRVSVNKLALFDQWILKLKGY